MWTATVLGFYSVVRDRQRKGHVLIRARAEADIWNLYRQFSVGYRGKDKGKGKRFAMPRPRSDEHRDYRWRVSIRQRDWAQIVYRLAMRINYHNFKDEVHKHPDQDNKNSAYLSVWSALLRVQHGEDNKFRPQEDRQRYFGGFDWRQEIEFACDRFVDDEPIPTKTIKSVLADNRELEDGQQK